MILRMEEYEVRKLLGTQETRRPRRPRPLKAEGYPLQGSVMLYLPWPPSNNMIWRHVRGRTILSEAAKLYRKDVYDAVCVQWPVGKPKPLNSRLFAVVILQAGHNHAYDIDNEQKALFDALQEAQVLVNDNQIDAMLVVRGMTRLSQPGIEVHLLNYEESIFWLGAINHKSIALDIKTISS